MRPFRWPVQAAGLIKNPGLDQLRRLARHEERTTQYGSAGFISRVRNRSAKNTYIVDCGDLGVDQQPISPEKAEQTAALVREHLKGRELIALDRQMGQNPKFSLHCRLYIPKEFARIALKWHNMLFEPVEPEAEPDLISIYVPDWPERVIFAHPDGGVTYILGTDYFGEAKKSFLRMALYDWKKQGGIGFHAGSKVLRVYNKNGALEDVGFIMFGLSGTGKTTLTIHDHGLTGGERVIIRQDDMVMMDGSGTCYGTENGFYIKTEGLDPSQRVLYNAATSPNALLENVMVYDDGRVDFDNAELTSNGRCVILRREVEGTDDRIDLDKANKIIFITRRDDIIPPVARLNPVQAAAFFMLGESIETSAGDPTRAGQSKREVGTNPFIIGQESAEGNRLLSILDRHPDMECYLLNTGSVGFGNGSVKKITIELSTGIMKHIAKGTIRWTYDPDWGYEVPVEVPGLEIERYNPRQFYSVEEYRNRVDKLRRERLRWLAKYKGLAPEIIQAVL
ncbi:MAG: phosphoenolpyruvate carboxykinase (ATP) [Firmicutes bacterium]|nr:phosphoenolpyruvate carboxykinase (ATP) [Bacillota bacterium]